MLNNKGNIPILQKPNSSYLSQDARESISIKKLCSDHAQAPDRYSFGNFTLLTTDPSNINSATVTGSSLSPDQTFPNSDLRIANYFSVILKSMTQIRSFDITYNAEVGYGGKCPDAFLNYRTITYTQNGQNGFEVTKGDIKTLEPLYISRPNSPDQCTYNFHFKDNFRKPGESYNVNIAVCAVDEENTHFWRNNFSFYVSDNDSHYLLPAINRYIQPATLNIYTMQHNNSTMENLK